MMISAASVAGSLILLLTALLATRWVGVRWSMHAETQRKTIHLGLGLYALTFPIIFTETWEVIALCSLAAMIMLGVRVVPGLSGNLGSALHGVNRESFGELLFPVSIALLFFLSKGEVVLYVLPLLILVLCDAFAAVVGVAYGRISFVIEKGKKSIEGSVMFFLTAWILAMIALLLLTDIPRTQVIYSAVIIAGLGTLLEGISWKGLDNLLIPFGLFLLTQWLLKSTLSESVTVIAVFLGILFLSAWLSARASQHTHAVITVITAAFFCWMVSGWRTVLAPALVFAGYLILRFRDEYESDDDSELPVVFCIISAALVWYVLSIAFEIGTYSAFNLSFGLHLVALMTIQPRRPTWIRWTGAVLAGWLVANIGLLFINEISRRDVVLSITALGLLVVASLVGLTVRERLLLNRWAKQAIWVVLVSMPVMAVP